VCNHIKKNLPEYLMTGTLGVNIECPECFEIRRTQDERDLIEAAAANKKSNKRHDPGRESQVNRARKEMNHADEVSGLNRFGSL